MDEDAYLEETYEDRFFYDDPATAHYPGKDYIKEEEFYPDHDPEPPF